MAWLGRHLHPDRPAIARIIGYLHGKNAADTETEDGGDDDLSEDGVPYKTSLPVSVGADVSTDDA